MKDMKHQKGKPRLKRINNGLSVLVVFLAAYIMFAPLLPNLSYWWKKSSPSKPSLVEAYHNGGSQNNEQVPDENTLVIPRLVLQEKINEGQTAAALSKGIWRRPKTSNPDQGGNTVIVGHRFTYNDPAVFYHLDKIQTGDEIVLYWDKAIYVYEVTRVFVVPASAVEIEAPTDQPLLTLYTCTPIWTAKDRLVVQAKLKDPT